jgi:hypothetical protein
VVRTRLATIDRGLRVAPAGKVASTGVAIDS